MDLIEQMFGSGVFVIQFHILLTSLNIFLVDAVCLHTIIGRTFFFFRWVLSVISYWCFVFVFQFCCCLDLFSIVNTDKFSIFEQRNDIILHLADVAVLLCRVSVVCFAFFNSLLILFVFFLLSFHSICLLNVY